MTTAETLLDLPAPPVRHLRPVPAARPVHLRLVEGGPPTPVQWPRPDDGALAALADRLRVAVLGPQSAALSTRLQRRWTVTRLDDARLDVVVLVEADGDAVRRLVADPRSPSVLALVPGKAPAALVVALLEAGADGCLRGTDPAEVDAHLQAMERRRRAARRPQLVPTHPSGAAR